MVARSREMGTKMGISDSRIVFGGTVCKTYL
jgi:hypothetical protein